MRRSGRQRAVHKSSFWCFEVVNMRLDSVFVFSLLPEFLFYCFDAQRLGKRPPEAVRLTAGLGGRMNDLRMRKFSSAR